MQLLNFKAQVPRIGAKTPDLSGRTGRALVLHTRESLFEPGLLQQVLRFAGSIYTM